MQVEERTEKFWAALEAYPMHLQSIPRDIEVDFLGALSFGASGESQFSAHHRRPMLTMRDRKNIGVERDLVPIHRRANAAAGADIQGTEEYVHAHERMTSC